MLRPAMSEIIREDENYYEFVVNVARKARQISQDAEDNKFPLEKKPVQLAVEDLANAKLSGAKQ